MLRFVYLANIFVVGLAGIVSILNDELASIVIYQKAFAPNPIMQLFGSVFLAIAVISFLGVLYPLQFSPILIFQVLYKLFWLTINLTLLKESFSLGVCVFFMIWIIILPFVIPWRYLFKSTSKTLKKK